MRIRSKLAPIGIFLTAALLSVLVANSSARMIELRSKTEVLRVLNLQGFEWVAVAADGLRVTLSGTALDESTRFKALRAAASVVSPDRIIDEIVVPDPDAIVPPRFSVEILRNDDGVSLIGLVPAKTQTGEIIRSIEKLQGKPRVTDMLERADYPTPDGWDAALKFGLTALSELPRSKISVSAGAVQVTAISDSREQQRALESRLARRKPDTVAVELNISAPRPVITPFTLRFLIGEEGIRFDACAADTEQARDRILGAARSVGLVGQASCTIGLGVPTPNWAEGVEVGIRKLAEIGGGSITFSDADVALVALDTTSQAVFDRVVGELETDLPDVFSLKAVLPQPVKIDGTGENPEIAEFVATRSPEGLVQLRGRVRDERSKQAITSFAQAHFGVGEVYAATRVDDALQTGWAIRVLAGLDAMAQLNRGSLVVQPDFVELRGETGNPDAREIVSRILSDKLGAEANFKLDITYIETLDPVIALPTPEECVASLNAVLEAQKIAFAPGSATIEAGGFSILDKLAGALVECAEVPMEIAGHTDSQGREVMNLNLSQARADAVLNGLMARDVLVTNLTSRGYGEAKPIADNDTEDGREANRRIEFTLIDPPEEVTASDPQETDAQTTDTQDTTAETASE